MARPGTGPRLYRRKGSPYWYIVWQGRDGQPRRMSTGARDREAAERVKARAILGLNSAGPQGVAEILRAFIDERGPLTASGKAQLKFPCQRIADFFASAPIDDLSPDRVAAYTAHRRAGKISDGTIRKELGILNAALRHAVKAGRIGAAPHIALPAEPPPRERWLTRKEAKALIAASGTPHLKLFIEIALATGARSGAILGLAWAQVDPERRRIEFNPPGRTRTNKRRAAVPINDHLLGILKAARKKAKSLHVIEWRGERVRSIKKGFALAAKRAGLENVTPNTLRHTAATWMAQAGVDLWAVGGVLGHASPKTTARYAKHHPDYLRAAVAALWPGIGQKPGASPGKQRLSLSPVGTPRQGKNRRKQPKTGQG